MSYFRTCPYCGANLDPGEICDCPDTVIGVAMLLTGDVDRWRNKNAAPSVTGTESGEDLKAIYTH